MGLKLPCDAHVISVVTGRTYGVIDGAISGIVSVVLALRPGASFAGVRRALREVLEASLDIVDSPPPPFADSAHMQQQRALLDLCLPNTAEGLRHKAIIQEHGWG